jgi:Hypothetical glycosyl hydrolase family 15
MKTGLSCNWLFTILISAIIAIGHARQSSPPNSNAKPVWQRIADRSFPSVFQAWNQAENLKEDPEMTIARHDLYWHVPEGFGLQWDGPTPGLATSFKPASTATARAHRDRLLARNPNMILLAEIRYRDAEPNYLPTDHRWWRHDAAGERVPGWEEGGYFQLDWGNAEFRAHVVAQAKAVVESGVVDGIMLDQWHEEDAGRLALLKRVRDAIGPDRLIIVNSSVHRVPKSAPYINGQFLENCFEPQRGTPCRGPKTPQVWKLLADSLLWAEKNLRQPHINAFETWFVDSRNELNRMRATTTLALTHSDGYVLFADPNDLPVPDHLHDWYPFWDFKSLGKPSAPMTKRRDGAFQREFSGGTVVYNPEGNKTVTVTFAGRRVSAATRKLSNTFTVDGMDGDLFLH